MRRLIAWALGLACVLGGFNAAARLQHWPQATLVADCGQATPCSYRGDVRTEFMTGDYLVTDQQGQQVHVPAARWRAMVLESNGVGLGCLVAGLLGLLGFVGFVMGPDLRRLARS